MIDCNLPAWILKLAKTGKEGNYSSTHKNFRKAYIQFAYKLTDLVLKLKHTNDQVVELIKKLPEWEKYEIEEYKVVHESQNKRLGDQNKSEIEQDTFEIEENVPEEKNEG